MLELRGSALFACVTCVTALGFFQIGFDNGLMGGLGKSLPFFNHYSKTNQALPVDGTAFNDTFNSPGATILGLIVAILEGSPERSLLQTAPNVH
jgi:hypothetical protein